MMFPVPTFLLLCIIPTSLGIHIQPVTTESQSNSKTDSNERATTNYIMEQDHAIGFSQKITITEDSPLFSKKSKYQDIVVHKSLSYGKILVLDDVVQITEKDGNSYNEMMAHVPMMEHRNPQHVLVIGGGDGYVLSEVLKHDSVEHVDHVDLDADVIETCKKYFSWGHAWEDERVTLHIGDGKTFVKNTPDEYYDVIIQDSSDPTGFDESGHLVELPSKVLYSKQHFSEIYRILREDGIFNFQAETFNIPADLEGICQWRSQALEVGFESARYGSLMISSYITGQIGFTMCKKKDDEASSMEEVQHRFNEMKLEGKTTSYYHPPLQTSSFDLPYWVEETIYNAKECSTAVLFSARDE